MPIPTISIITPVWNGLPFIKECVESVFYQDFQDWELIISDNGSTDGTKEYLDTLTDPRVRIYKQESNLGIDGNLNFLTRKALAPIAYCLCADDYLYKGALTAVVKEWTLVSSDTAFIGFNWKEVKKHDMCAAFSYEVLPKELRPEVSQLAFFLFGNVLGNLSNVSFKVHVLISEGGFNENMKMAGDLEMWQRIAKTHTMYLSDTETSYIRRHENTATSYMSKQGILLGEHILVYNALINDLSRSQNRAKLIEYFNIQISSYHLRDAIKAVLHGRLINLKIFLNLKSDIFWPKWKRLLVCLPYALSENSRERLLINLSRKMLKGTIRQ